ncbi:MAG TPA: fumarylacetoacetate hydrolase family protein, partial [Telluria sp.]|nr:fumarylacetoacetate hydrolase family protein [Telluria sp.]
MKLVRYGRPGKEKPGMLDEEGRLRALSGVLDDIGPAALSPQALRKLAKLDPKTLPLVRGTPRFGVPLTGVGKFIAIGLNYADHAAEAGLPLPTEPVVFMKAVSCLSGPDDPVMLPLGATKGDWEVELGVVIGSRARQVSEAEALDHV